MQLLVRYIEASTQGCDVKIILPKPRGLFVMTALDRRGNIKWQEKFPNGVTVAGLNDLLSVAFASGTQKPNWYGGLINGSGFSSLSSGDTAASHSGWTEATRYSQSTRPAWTPGTPSGGALAGTAALTFSINASSSIQGGFLISNSTKGGTSGILYATGSFSSGARSLSNGDTLSVAYSVSFAP
jgi:hypothetical protein